MTKEENSLKNLKEKYSKLQKKYELPEFKKLNEDFQIENIQENETEFLLREIRKFLADKIANYLRFTENLLNPVNVPMFVYSIVKTIGTKEKEIIKENYKKLTELEIDLIEIDLEYSEEKEAEFIKKSFSIWQKIKKDLLEIIKNIKSKKEIKIEKNNKNYYG